MRIGNHQLAVPLLLLSVLGVALTIAGRAQEAPVAELDAEIAALLPTAEEQAFRSIPWFLNLMEARAAAAAQGRPLFLWIMNGHPFGCT